MRLILVAGGLYLVFLPFWWYSLEYSTGLLASIAEAIYRLFDARVSMAGSGRNINFYIRDSNGEVVSSALRLDTVTYGLPMLAALILGTKSNSLVAKGRALLFGMLLMSVITVPAVMLWAKMTSLQLEEQVILATTGVRGGRANFFFYAFHGYAFSQPVIAVGIWLALIMLGQMNRAKKETAAVAGSAAPSLSRNAPCPCGSGLKYKRCCGAA